MLIDCLQEIYQKNIPCFQLEEKVESQSEKLEQDLEV
jgi:hypothetical protein